MCNSNNNTTSDSTMMALERQDKMQLYSLYPSLLPQMGRTISSECCKPSRRLPSNFQPTRFDVVCGRRKNSRVHEGTEHFRRIIKDNVKRYTKIESKDEKSKVVKSIVNFIKSEAIGMGGAGFVKYDTKHKCWIDIGDAHAREKVGHALRDILKQKSRLDKSSADPRRFMYIPSTTTTGIGGGGGGGGGETAKPGISSLIWSSPSSSSSSSTTTMSTSTSSSPKHKNNETITTGADTMQSLFQIQQTLFMNSVKADLGEGHGASQIKDISDYYDKQNTSEAFDGVIPQS